MVPRATKTQAERGWYSWLVSLSTKRTEILTAFSSGDLARLVVGKTVKPVDHSVTGIQTSDCGPEGAPRPCGHSSIKKERGKGGYLALDWKVRSFQVDPGRNPTCRLVMHSRMDNGTGLKGCCLVRSETRGSRGETTVCLSMRCCSLRRPACLGGTCRNVLGTGTRSGVGLIVAVRRGFGSA